MKTLQERLRDAANTGISDALEAADKLDAQEKLIDELRAKLQAPAIDERAEFEKWANKHKGGDPLKANENGSYPNPFANAAFEAWQAARKLSAPVVPDGLLDAVKEIAGSHTDNEITDRPVWWIIDPYQMMSPSVHEVYSMFKGPFFSREVATEYMEGHRYRYGKRVKVYCGSCNDAPQFKRLYDMSKAMLKGEK